MRMRYRGPHRCNNDDPRSRVQRFAVWCSCPRAARMRLSNNFWRLTTRWRWCANPCHSIQPSENKMQSVVAITWIVSLYYTIITTTTIVNNAFSSPLVLALSVYLYVVVVVAVVIFIISSSILFHITGLLLCLWTSRLPTCVPCPLAYTPTIISSVINRIAIIVNFPPANLFALPTGQHAHNHQQ